MDERTPASNIVLSPEHGIRHSIKAVIKSKHRWGKILLKLGILIVLIALIAIFGKWAGTKLPIFETWIKSLGWWGPAVFILIFIILTLIQVPESLLAIAGGVAFGLWWGFTWVIIANILGAAAAFWCYRLLLRHRLQNILKKHPKLQAVEAAVSSKGFKLMVLLRLGPFNYSILNTILGASEVRFIPFILAMIGAFPGNFATVYFGTVATHIAQKRAGDDTMNTTHEIILVAGFVVTVIVCLFIAHVAHHALKQAEADLEAGGATETVS